MYIDEGKGRHLQQAKHELDVQRVINRRPVKRQSLGQLTCRYLLNRRRERGRRGESYHWSSLREINQYKNHGKCEPRPFRALSTNSSTTGDLRTISMGSAGKLTRAVFRTCYTSNAIHDSNCPSIAHRLGRLDLNQTTLEAMMVGIVTRSMTLIATYRGRGFRPLQDGSRDEPTHQPETDTRCN